MGRCDRCVWGDQCHTSKDDCIDYTPLDEDEGLEQLIEEGLYEFRHFWSIYVQENEK